MQTALEANELDKLGALLHELHPSEVADLLEALPAEARAAVWARVDRGREGDVLSHASSAVRSGLLENMAPSELAEATSNLDLDDIADILQGL